MESHGFIDAHVHANNRSGEDFVRLCAVGCRAVVAVAGPEGGFRSPDSVLDHYRRLDVVDRPRVERAGLKYFLALGIHPAGIPETGSDELLSALPGALAGHGAVAVGEIGLEQGGDLEEQLLLGQLSTAAKLGLGAIVHTPRRDKARAVERTLELISESGLPPERVLLDHVNGEVLPQLLGCGCYLGLSIHPAKLSPEEAAEQIERHGPRWFILSTDMGVNPSHLFGIPAAVSAMLDRGINREGIRAVVYDNAARFLGHHP